MHAPFVRLGRVVRPHGTAGEVSVRIERGVDLEELPGVTVWIVPPLESGVLGRHIVSVRPGPKGPLVSLEGITQPETARRLAGRWLLARADAVSVPVPAVPDLYGYSVVDATRGRLGDVRHVIVTGANDVLVVEGGPFGQVLIPVIDDVVSAIDAADRIVHVHLLEGLLEEDRS